MRAHLAALRSMIKFLFARTKGDHGRVDVIEIGPDQVEQHVRDGWTLLDVRTDGEWADGRIEGAVHLPLDQLIARQDEVPDRVVCVCAVGARSAQAASYLAAQGRETVNLAGGVYAWQSSGRSLTR
ncbi:rhodanese-like domain-containing protein [Microlunatus parietis]|uniref:Rhodanese-related sulfurtransferase n=1 Tax=Microlunatus parietis TaxID=682979 RepID=A0A7Y9I7W4_9ACTN|nr:rhodanese-like domain-containing protein [Microlunatus parietis]NYE71966.1 rhodanese-related sulfurtransferase [Microlunatus parietis]